jgi:hypothetical protein
MAAVEDKPLDGDVVLVDMLGDSADNLLGWLEEILMAANAGWQATQPPVDLEQIRGALVTCQEQFNRITHCFSTDLMRYERIAELTRVGRERGGMAAVVGQRPRSARSLPAAPVRREPGAV